MGFTILIVDDLANNRKLLATIIKQNSTHNVIIASNAQAVLEMFARPDTYSHPDLILLDIMMPQINGFELARQLKTIPKAREIPIIFVTALSDTENIINAFKLGGVDYITKPFKKEELMARVNTHLELIDKRRSLEISNQLLQSRKELLASMVEEKTRTIKKLTLSLVCALENANLLNDSDTGNHVKRVSRYSVLLARAYGCDREFVNRIKLYASLHDVGKVGTTDKLLKKPGKYTPEEFEEMKQHVHYAAQMLGGEGVDEMVRNIAVFHHERWDGSGYLQHLKGTEIPLEARIVAIADVYDALTSERVYKKALSREEAEKIIRQEAGAHFDPSLVSAFFKVKDEILEVTQE